MGPRVSVNKRVRAHGKRQGRSIRGEREKRRRGEGAGAGGGAARQGCPGV